MITVVGPRLRQEAERFQLRFRCEDCQHYDPDADDCAFAYPTEPHRGIDLAQVDALVFCKLFELV